MTFIDTGILVGALLAKHPEHPQCLAALKLYPDCVTDAHTLAETFSTLTGFYKIPVDAAAELTLGLEASLKIEPLPLSVYKMAIREARGRGVMGGGIYDALHSTFARSKRATRIITRNPSHFAHTAPELEILTP